LFLFSFCLPCAAQEARFPVPTADGLLAAATDTVCAPAHFDAKDWGYFGLFGAGFMGVYAADKQIRNAFQRSRGNTTDKISDVAYTFGQGQYLLPELAAAYGISYMTDDRKLASTSIMAAESFLIAGGVTTVLKYTFHQARPNSAPDNNIWHGPSLDNYDQSFPSGHATVAFAVAGVFAKQYPDGAAPYAAYGVAGLCGLARINADAHWASDVLVGAAIGIFTARHVVESATPVKVIPLVSQNSGGLMLAEKF